jgi:MFS family permease
LPIVLSQRPGKQPRDAELDTTDSFTRSRFFSLNIGIFCIGVAIGPTIGGALISYSSDILSVFYMSAAINLAVALIYWLVVPESLPEEAMQEAKLQVKQLSDAQKIWQSMISSLSTLSMFVPKRIEGVTPDDDESFITSDRTLRDGKVRKPTDYNMSLLAICALLASISVVSAKHFFDAILCNLNTSIQSSYSFIFEYTGAEFGWRSEQVGYRLFIRSALQLFFC